VAAYFVILSWHSIRVAEKNDERSCQGRWTLGQDLNLSSGVTILDPVKMGPTGCAEMSVRCVVTQKSAVFKCADYTGPR